MPDVKLYYSVVGVDCTDEIITFSTLEAALSAAEEMEKAFVSHGSDEFPTLLTENGHPVKEWHWKY